MKRSKYIYLLAGPSGSGKSSVARKITEWYGFKEVWSYTERPPRYAGEPGHVFVTPEEFDAAGPMCAFTLYNGYRYGVPQSEIDSSLLYVIDPAGIEYMKNHYAGSKGTTAMTLASLITDITSVFTAVLSWLNTVIKFVTDNPILLIFVLMVLVSIVVRVCRRWIPGL